MNSNTPKIRKCDCFCKNLILIEENPVGTCIEMLLRILCMDYEFKCF